MTQQMTQQTPQSDPVATLSERFREIETRIADDPDRSWLLPFRRQAMEAFSDRGFPTTRDEEWKYCNLAPLTKLSFQRATSRSPVQTRRPLEDLPTRKLSGGIRMVFVNGFFSDELSTRSADGSADLVREQGAIVRPLRRALRDQREQVEAALGKMAGLGGGTANPFVALNTAFLQDGAFIHVPRGVVLEQPIHVVFLSTGAGDVSVAYPRNLILVEEDAQVSVIEDYASADDASFFTNPVTETRVDHAGVLRLTKVVRESFRSFHVAGTYASIGADATFRSNSVTRGGRIVRNDLAATLNGEGANCLMNGLNVVCGTQLFDDHTSITHALPHGTSQQYYKSILDEQAQGVFNGKVWVAEDAQKTNAQQANRNLVLSPQALMNTKPQLEIFADDVKCSHGATIGQLDQDALFYLRTRGIGFEEARAMLTHAFADDVIGRIEVEPVREMVRDMMTFPLCRRAGYSAAERQR